MSEPTSAGDLHHGQAAVVALLADAATYPHEVDGVVHIQTHISHVFLAGAYVYKLKKAVVFPFLDFGTREAREHFCREELRLNRRLARAVYLDVLAITAEGRRLRLGGDGTPVDWVVRMRRLPPERTLALLVEQDAVSGDLIERIAQSVAEFHAEAPVVPGGAPPSLVAGWDENLAGVRPMVGRFLPREELEVLEDFGRTFVERHDAVLEARPQLGHVREGHGDLRADHVYVLDRELPALADAARVPPGVHIVDCVEFSPAFRSIDVAADIAFLAMELESLGREDLAGRFVRAYAAAANDTLAPALVPYYACHRATVRGKVEGLAAGEREMTAAEREGAAVRARRQFALAGRFAWRSGDPVVIACTGFSGSGKSAVAERIGRLSGWPVVASDVLRKQLALSDPDRGYAPDARSAVYARLRREVEHALSTRTSVVVDATFLERGERDRLARVVRGYGWRHLFVECVAGEEVVRRRLAARDARSVSDARWDVYVDQRRAYDRLGSDEPVLSVNTSGTLDEVGPDLVARLWAWRQGRPVGREAPR